MFKKNFFSIISFFLWVLIIIIPILSLVFASLMSNASLSDGILSLKYVFENMLSTNEVIERFRFVIGDRTQFLIMLHSIVLSLIVAIIVSVLSWIVAFYTTRKKNFLAKYSLPLSLFTYLTPPVILVISFASIWSNSSTEFIWLKILFSHCVYLFPIAFVLSYGFWIQKPYEIDRMAAIDGASFWERLLLHAGLKELLYMTIVGMLIFMISWSDIIFSRILASSNSEERLLVDYIFERLFSNAVIEEFGVLAFFSLFVVLVSTFISVIFGYIFYYGIVRNK